MILINQFNEMISTCGKLKGLPKNKNLFYALNLQKKIKITFIFITHDQEEAIFLSDRIQPIRIDFFDQNIETISEFDTLTQKTNKKRNSKSSITSDLSKFV